MFDKSTGKLAYLRRATRVAFNWMTIAVLMVVGFAAVLSANAGYPEGTFALTMFALGLLIGRITGVLDAHAE